MLLFLEDTSLVLGLFLVVVLDDLRLALFADGWSDVDWFLGFMEHSMLYWGIPP